MLGALAAFSTIPGRIAEATEARRIGSPGLNTDQLGESLKKFRSLHPDAKCIVRPIDGPRKSQRRRSQAYLVYASEDGAVVARLNVTYQPEIRLSD
jgi:hypothetical protein